MSDPASGEDWIGCYCANPGCKMFIPLRRVTPDMRNANGDIEIPHGLGRDRAPCQRCLVTTYFSPAELVAVHVPGKTPPP